MISFKCLTGFHSHAVTFHCEKIQVCRLRDLVVAARGASFPLVVVGNKADLGPQIHKEVFQVSSLKGQCHVILLLVIFVNHLPPII